MSAQRHLFQKVKENVLVAFHEYRRAQKSFDNFPILNEKLIYINILLGECEYERNSIIETARKHQGTTQLVSYLSKNCEEIRQMHQNKLPVSKLITDVESRIFYLDDKLKSGENVLLELYNSLNTSRLVIEKCGMQYVEALKNIRSDLRETKIVLLNSLSLVERILSEIKTPKDFTGGRIYTDEDICLAVFNSKWGRSKMKLPSLYIPKLNSIGTREFIGNRDIWTDGKKMFVSTMARDLRRRSVWNDSQSQITPGLSVVGDSIGNEILLLQHTPLVSSDIVCIYDIPDHSIPVDTRTRNAKVKALPAGKYTNTISFSLGGGVVVSAECPFREMIEDILHDDFTSSDEFLVRWIRDRELNLHAAEIMIRKHFMWRKKNKIDSILSEDVDDYVTTRCLYKVESYDREGRPVVEMPAGEWRGREMVEAGKADQLGLQVYRMMEEAVLANRNTKHNNCDEVLPLCISIVDLANLSYKQLGTKESLSTIVHIIKLVCDNYPEVIETSYIINAPVFFKIIFKFFKAVIPSRYVSRTHIFGKDRCEWEPILQELISPDQLRIKYGGMKENF